MLHYGIPNDIPYLYMDDHPHKCLLELIWLGRIAAVDQPYLQSSDIILKLSHFSIIHYTEILRVA